MIFEQTNSTIANWVKQGGTVLYIGGSDDYESIAGEWWTNKGQTPYQNLIAHLGLNVSVAKPNRSDKLNWAGNSGYGTAFQNVTCSLSKFINTYSGSG
ncbi:MAG: hypothetical protein IKZ24_03660, partial [Burkholderiaceae bacterium]|nr:hypothetical protein [Burkholderiaceae bacterium]